jgi:hypothetical protein
VDREVHMIASFMAGYMGKTAGAEKEAGDAEELFSRGVRYALNHNDTEAVKWWHKAAERGHAKAQHTLGELYDYGIGVPKDEAESVKWYRKAAEQGLDTPIVWDPLVQEKSKNKGSDKTPVDEAEKEAVVGTLAGSLIGAERARPDHSILGAAHGAFRGFGVDVGVPVGALMGRALAAVTPSTKSAPARSTGDLVNQVILHAAPLLGGWGGFIIARAVSRAIARESGVDPYAGGPGDRSAEHVNNREEDNE